MDVFDSFSSERAEFENRHISVVLEKIEELPKLAPVVVDEEEYVRRKTCCVPARFF